MILNILIENKPNISNSSLKTYNSTLTNFFYDHHPRKTNINIKWFDIAADMYNFSIEVCLRLMEELIYIFNDDKHT